jgi:uncharacterized protein involved in type VI secretion and phage assembly
MNGVFDALLPSPSGAGGLIFGVCCGVVTNAKDPNGRGRVKVKLPWLAADNETTWARVTAPMAGANRGVCFVPAVGDEVLIAFEHGRPERPYVLGGLWNGLDAPPEPNSDGKSDVHAIRTGAGHVIRFVDTDQRQRIEISGTGGKNQIVIDTANNTVTIHAGNDVVITAGSGKLTLSGGSVDIASDRDLTLTAGGRMAVTATADLRLAGRVIDIN